MSERIQQAKALAEELHGGQVRKGTSQPYVSHPIAVSAQLEAWGADENTVIAGLLHDTVEDCGGLATAQVIRERFGGRVADLVLECSDSVSEDPLLKLDWRERKQAHINRLATASTEAALVMLADKTHNMMELVEDFERDGNSTLQRFKEPESLLWYFGRVMSTCSRDEISALVKEQVKEQFVAFGVAGYVALRLAKRKKPAKSKSRAQHGF